MSLIDEVKLGVGESQILFPIIGNVPEIKLIDNRILKEVKIIDGRAYVFTGYNKPGVSEERKFLTMSQVLVYSPPRLPIMGTSYEGKGALPPLSDLVTGTINEFDKRVGVPPYINGFRIFNKKGDEIKESIRGGDDKITVGSKATIELMLMRYVPATQENVQRFTQIFGPYVL